MSSTNPLLPLPTSPPSSSDRPTSAAPVSNSPSPTPSGASSSSSSSATQATTQATSATSSPSSPSAAPVTTPQLTTSPNGVVATVTSTSFVVATQPPTSQGSNSTSSNSFFSNKGAVAGVFAVVGVIGVALVIALIINGVRRRRAQKFDRDVAEAAAEAAASSRSPFDDYGYPNAGGNGGGPGGGYGYSDNSHGTYQLPPMSPQSAPYGMTEMAQYDPYAAGAAPLAAAAVGRSRSRKDSDPRAPGIAGVGAGTLVREPTKRAPYHAFAGPAPQSYDIPSDNGRYGSRRSNQDILEAAGLGVAGAVAGAAAMSANVNTHNGAGPGGAYITRKPSDTTQNTQFSGGRSKFGSLSSGGNHPTTLQPGYPVDSYYPQRNDSLSPDPFAGYPITAAPAPQGLPNPHNPVLEPLPSIAGHQTDHAEDYVDTGSPTALRSDEPRMSYQDDTDYSQGHRVLRVANE